jgi:hypothetical protein
VIRRHDYTYGSKQALQIRRTAPSCGRKGNCDNQLSWLRTMTTFRLGFGIVSHCKLLSSLIPDFPLYVWIFKVFRNYSKVNKKIQGFIVPRNRFDRPSIDYMTCGHNRRPFPFLILHKARACLHMHCTPYLIVFCFWAKIIAAYY